MRYVYNESLRSRLALTYPSLDLSTGKYNTVATLTACVLVGFVLAVGLAVTKELLVDALSVTARQFPFWANGFVGLEDG